MGGPDGAITTGREAPGEPPATDDETAARLTPWRDLYFDAATSLNRGLVIGLLCGALIGGVGGRLAMFVLRVTSDESVRGLKTDDDFTIGEFTGDTVFLVAFAALLGAAGGLLYILGREWLPPRARPAVCGLFFGTLGGSAFVEPGGIDFTLLEPLWLAVAMFIALPALYGVALSALIERRIVQAKSAESNRGRRGWVSILRFLPLGLILVGGPFGVAAALLGALLIAANRSGEVARVWRSMPAVWLGRGALAVATGLAGFELFSDAADIL